MCLSDMLYTSVEDHNKAQLRSERALASYMKDSSPVTQQNGGAGSSKFHTTESNTKVAYNISTRLKQEDRFSEKRGKNLNETINLYMDEDMDYELCNDEKFYRAVVGTEWACQALSQAIDADPPGF